jgi:phage tail sheath protein FI
VRNGLGITTVLSDSQIGELYNGGINSFRAIPGAGIVILGARTLETVRPDKYVPIRRSLNYIKQRSLDLTQFAVFEPNDERLWNAIKVRLGSMLTDLWSAGGLKGNSTSEAFYIVCDDSNNTPTVIENGEVRVEIGVSLQYPAEFIIINISQFAGGATL